MAYRYGNRNQVSLFPESIEDYVGKDDPVRAYDAIIDSLDCEKLGIEIDPQKVGNSEYDPKAMLKLLVYAYAYGWKSSRKIERACYHNLSFIWLMGGLKPDHKTISKFRRDNRQGLKQALRQVVRICIRLDLIDGNIVFVDGTKIRANAGRSKNHTREYYEREIHEIDKRIERMLEECEKIDEEESGQESYVKMQEEIRKDEELRRKVQELLKEFEIHEGIKTVNETDRESRLMKSAQGSHASYNIQSVVDDKHGLIVNVEGVSETNDVNQFAKQIEQAEDVMGKQCKVAVADAGYADTEELEKIDKRGTEVIVPSQRQALHNPEKAFSKSEFMYDPEKDCYYCPTGQRLKYKGHHGGDRTKLEYQIEDKNLCKGCQWYGKCTQAQKGRKIIRLVKEEIKEKLERKYEEPKNQLIYARRKMRVEHPFGHIKRNLGITHFLLRGREKIQAEIAVGALCFNIARMITLLGGVRKFTEKLSTI